MRVVTSMMRTRAVSVVPSLQLSRYTVLARGRSVPDPVCPPVATTALVVCDVTRHVTGCAQLQRSDTSRNGGTK